MLLQSYFLFPVLSRKPIFLKKKKIQISCVYYLLSQRFLYLMMAKLPNVRNNLLEEMNPQRNCIVSKVTCFQEMEAEKKSKENLSTVKEYWRLAVFKFFFLFLRAFLFFLLVLSFFRGLSIISSVKYFFVGAYPFKNICQMEIVVNVYLPE